MHDPLAVYYAMLDDDARKDWVVEHNVDIRVECTGTWTRGMTLLDQRVRGQRPFEKREDTAFSDEVGGGRIQRRVTMMMSMMMRENGVVERGIV